MGMMPPAGGGLPHGAQSWLDAMWRSIFLRVQRMIQEEIAASFGSVYSGGKLDGSAISGTLPASTLPATGVTPATYGDATHIPELTVDATGRITTASSATISSGMTNPMTTEGDLIYEHSGSPARLAVGANQTMLVSNGTDPTWTNSPTVSGETTAQDFKAAGLTGATAASRYVGATASGAPATGTFALGDYVIDQTAKLWVCTAAGTPGTWANVGTAGSFSDPTTTKGDLIVHGSSTTRLPVGTDGQVLTARSTATNGVDWETPLAGGSADDPTISGGYEYAFNNFR